ncbi:MAG: TonB-dependent receptor [Tsuneonella suprasediminis]|uniref:TonB-dependent receptor n=1 Tax=Tsuneonella suprasediminis TaxID=2306996 RepID=A0A419QY91_9SPHN|nr:TonB-dependent receptor [Tsuneonella suprasediminis]RJX65635.1 TonB-dependent receptor [Tsuneonella suprasediminis]UBS33537.1 TonB-dependent receptor [Altererythrobacter sp. N1]
MHFGRLFIASVSTLAFATPAVAQDAAEADGDAAVEAAASSDIVVTATRTQLPASALPLTIDVLDSETFNRQLTISGSTVDAVSALLPSFSPTREKLSGAGESLRGRSPLYAIDGIPQSTPVRDGSRDGYTIDPFFIDRVEVIYGSNALQGIGGTGGVVNQVTVAAPKEDGVSIRTLLQGTASDSFAGEALGGKAAALAGWRNGAFDASIGGAFERRGAFIDGAGKRIGVDGAQGEIQDSDSWSVFGRLGYDLGPDTRVELVANHFELQGNGHYVRVPGDRAEGRPSSSELGQTPGDPPSNTADMVSLSLTDKNLAGGTFTLQGFYNRTRDLFGGDINSTFQDPAIDPTGQLFDQSANKSRKVGGKVTYERGIPGFDDLVVTLGFDALFDKTEQTLIQTGRAWVPETEFRSLAPFAQANLKLLDGVVRLAGGVRHEDVKLTVDDYHTLASYSDNGTPIFVAGGSPSFSRTLFNGGVIVEPIQGLRAYGSFAEGFTIADVGRILRSISEEGVDIDDFLSLEPVISNNKELGVELERGPVKATASYFWSSSKLGSRLVMNSDGIFEVVRAPVDIEGLELNLKTQTPVPGLDVSFGYSHLVGKTDGNGDGILEADLDGANISPDRLNLAADFTRGRFSARAQGRFYLSRTFDGQPADSAFEGYTLLDAYIGYRTGLGLVSLGIQNALDEYYLTYDSDTVRTFDNSRYFAGRGRTFTLSLQSEF